MKKQAFLFTAFFASTFLPLSAQVSIAPFYSVTYQEKSNGEFREKTKPFGAILSYDLNEKVGLGLQFRNFESWSLNEKIDRKIAMRTISLHFNLPKLDQTRPTWMFGPVCGVYAGIGQIHNETKNQSMRENWHVLKYPYFGGIFLQANAGFDLKANLQLALFVRTEASFGVIANRPFGIQSNASSTGVFSIGLRLTYLSQKKLLSKISN
ncbi:MAG TPA: hypothetical protein VJ103_00940 [Candidatus Paceibacterota bacterium]|nr:hypothetical protein [Candidatus Paceibacterota bacterium]